ncbi:MAG: ankyrin repeat domain-containing protein [Planctomycetes bacterium]|nr:ankyrin repeat domain-containing protein [Planctomycetota bacterium]
MLIRQRIYNGLIGALLVGLVVGLGGCPKKTPTEQLLDLCYSLKAEDIAEIRELIQAGADINVKNKFGMTPLLLAAEDYEKEIITVLLAAGANVNAANDYGMTPLSSATKRDHSEVVKLLREHGASE